LAPLKVFGDFLTVKPLLKVKQYMFQLFYRLLGTISQSFFFRSSNVSEVRSTGFCDFVYVVRGVDDMGDGDCGAAGKLVK